MTDRKFVHGFNPQIHQQERRPHYAADPMRALQAFSADTAFSRKNFLEEVWQQMDKGGASSNQQIFVNEMQKFLAQKNQVNVVEAFKATQEQLSGLESIGTQQMVQAAE